MAAVAADTAAAGMAAVWRRWLVGKVAAVGTVAVVGTVWRLCVGGSGRPSGKV
jgi:hypothetical protein